MNPLQGVLGEAWRLYRTRAVRLILLAAALVLPALGVDYLIYGYYSSGTWSFLAGLFAAWLVLGLVTRIVAGGHDARQGRMSSAARIRDVMKLLAGGAVLAAVPGATWGLLPFMGPFGALLAIPVLCLTFLSLLTMPVIAIERASLVAALRRSWHLLRGHIWEMLGTLAGAWVGGLALMIIPIAIASTPSLAAPLHTEILRIAEGVIYGPFLAVVVALTYSRLAAAGSATVFTPAPQPGG